MARVPVIDSPCPIAGKRVPGGASEHCSTCDRAVFNLNSMSDLERRAFMGGCSGKVCVAYTVRVPLRRSAFAASLAVAALVALPAAADVAEVSDVGPERVAPAAEPPAGAMSPLPSEEPELPNCDEYDDLVLVGGVLDAGNAEWVDDGAEAAPELPTVEDDGK